MKESDRISLIAPCGMNCSICMAYLRDKNKCPGCRGSDAHKPVTRVKCKIKACDILQKEKIKYCFQCEKFPCGNMEHLDKRYRTKYDMSMVENLEDIKELGQQDGTIRTQPWAVSALLTATKSGGKDAKTKDTQGSQKEI